MIFVQKANVPPERTWYRGTDMATPTSASTFSSLALPNLNLHRNRGTILDIRTLRTYTVRLSLMTALTTPMTKDHKVLSLLIFNKASK